MTFDKQLTARQAAVESKSNRSCNHRIRLNILSKSDIHAHNSAPHSVSVVDDAGI